MNSLTASCPPTNIVGAKKLYARNTGPSFSALSLTNRSGSGESNELNVQNTKKGLVVSLLMYEIESRRFLKKFLPSEGGSGRDETSTFSTSFASSDLVFVVDGASSRVERKLE